MNSEEPEGWQRLALEDTIDVLDSMRIPLNSDERYEMKGNIPYYGANGVVDYIDRYIFDEELVLIAEDGGFFDEYQTRPIAYKISGKSWVNNHAHVLRVKSNFCFDFIFYSLEHKNLIPIIKGGTRTKLNQAELRQISMVIPKSLSEQKKIAAILQSVDYAIEKTKELIEKHEKIKQGLMHDLFTNGVDEQGVQYSQTKEHSLFGKMPAHWREGLMRYICDVSQGLQIAITERKTRPGRNRYVYITIQYLNAEDKVKSAEFIENPPKSVICSEEDVLMTRTGNTGQVITGYSGVFHNNFFIVKYDKSKVIKKYLVYYIFGFLKKRRGDALLKV
jgi:type I restriction enzyme S subunit